jgi:hypothetical protein
VRVQTFSTLDEALAGAGPGWRPALQACVDWLQSEGPYRELSAGTEALLAGASAAAADVTREQALAWQRYPEFRSSGAHGNEPDPRAIQHFATITYVEKSGAYLPDELITRWRRGDLPDSYVSREAIRVVVLMVAVRAAMDAMASGGLAPGDYAAAVETICQRIGRISLGI